MYVNNNIIGKETQGFLIETGYQKVSKNRFRKQQNNEKYSTKILQTFCRRGVDGKAYKISEKRFKKLDSSGANVFIKNKYFSKKLEENQPDNQHHLECDSPLGTWEKLPRELITDILGFLSPFEQNKIKTISRKILELFPDQLNQPEYAIAYKNLEIARPYLLIPSIFDFFLPFIQMNLYLDSNGNIEAYQGGSGTEIFYEKEPNSNHFKSHERGRLSSSYYELTLNCHHEVKEKNWKKNKFSLGVQSDSLFSHVDNEVVKKVAQHTFILANQLYDGANEIARKEGKMTKCDFPDQRPRPHWEKVFVDTEKYSMEDILEAAKGIKHLALETKPQKKKRVKTIKPTKVKTPHNKKKKKITIKDDIGNVTFE